VHRDDVYEAFRARIPEQFHTCPDHGGLFMSVVDESQTSVTGGVWEWAVPRFAIRFWCCDDRRFRLSMRRIFNPKHPRYRAYGAPFDPGHDELRMIDGPDVR
jgi:hypothetical protein